MTRKILITSSLPYVNNVPHLGNIIGSLLSADVYSRYCKQRKYNSIYVCGTDEYGTTTEKKAKEESVTPRELCDNYYQIHKQVYEFFNIEFDAFGRTSTEKQTEIAQEIFMDLYERGLIIEKTLKQLYDPINHCFLVDRFVRATCPHCYYHDSNGDQCDKCGKLLEAEELINPTCRSTGTSLELRSEEHLYLDLETLQPEIESWFDNTIREGKWSDNAISTTKEWFRRGLTPRCITRNLQWGTPVPIEKHKDKVFYVWFDAPIGYISITPNWKEWWQDSTTELVQFMGKDNIPFHSIIFPATLIGASNEWIKVKSLSSTEYLNYENDKFSKSKGIGVFGDQVQQSGISADVWRYYLLSIRPEKSDTSFSWDDFQAKINNELVANLGNLVNRVLKFTCKIGSKLPNRNLTAIDLQFIDQVNILISGYIEALENLNLKKGLSLCMKISKITNMYLAREDATWKSTNQERLTIINISAQVIYLLAILIRPYLPQTSASIFAQLNIEENSNIPTSIDINAILVGHKIGVIEPLFNRISNEEIAKYKQQFSS